MSFEVGRELNTQTPFNLDIANIVTKRTYIASMTRFGKSYLARKIIEECFGHSGIIIIDPEGEYSSLREKYGFLIIGKDVPLQVETAEFMAEKVLESNISVIIDTSMIEDDKEYVRKFLQRLFFLETVARKPYLILAEEAEDYTPEHGAPGTSECLQIMNTLAKKGGKRGIGVVFIGHRPAWISKGILSQCGNKAIGKIETTDEDALEKYARISHDIIMQLESIPDLDERKGEFYFTGDWVKKSAFVKVGKVKTTHLGYTPQTIPPSPKELLSIVTSLKKDLPQFIEKVRPTVISHAEIEAKIRRELETKSKDRIETILKTADEKADRKYKVEIDRLKAHIDELSRSKTLEQTSPISDVLEHPIVKSRMLQLDEKARMLLTKVEHEPGVSREQLAAFLTASKDSVVNTIDKINKIFKVQVIIGEGKPIQYKSMLKRLYISDVGKREIEELTRLQTELRQNRLYTETLRDQYETLKKANAESIQKLNEVMPALDKAQKTNQQQTIEIEKLRRDYQEFMLMNKANTALSTGIKEFVDNHLKEIQSTSLVSSTSSLDEKKVAEIAKQVFAPFLQELRERPKDNVTQQPNGTAITLEQKVTSFELIRPEEHVKADTTTIQGRILYTILKDPAFWDKRHNPPEVTTKLGTFAWTHDSKEVGTILAELCTKGIFTRILSTGNYWWYTLTLEAKQLIKEA
jgi:hypothetical protein